MTDKTEMSGMPETAWLEDEFGEGHEDQGGYGIWDCQNVCKYNHPYIRKDIHDAVVAERDALRADNERLRGALEKIHDCVTFPYATPKAEALVAAWAGSALNRDTIRERVLQDMARFDQESGLLEGDTK